MEGGMTAGGEGATARLTPTVELVSEDERDSPSSVGDTLEEYRRDREGLDGLLAENRGLGLETADWLTRLAEADGDGYADKEVGASVEMVQAVLLQAGEYAKSLQRILAARASVKYTHGRLPPTAPFRTVHEAAAMRYSVEAMTKVLSIEDGGGVYERLQKANRVVTNLMAPTGFGKTTRFPAEVAKRAGVRVLQLEPDHRLAMQAANAQKHHGIVTRAWSKVRKSRLVTMSYAEFMGKMTGEDGARLLQQVDVVYMDEVHVCDPDIEASKYVVASRAGPELSLLSVTATLEGEDAQTLGGSRREIYTSRSLDELIKEGKLYAGEVARDRTLIIVPNDAEAARISHKIASDRYLVKFLDSAATNGDVEKVKQFLEAEDSMVKRFVVAVNEFGVGINLPVSLVVTSGFCEVTELSEDRLSVTRKLVRLDKGTVKQHFGRVGRGMASAAVAVACGEETEFLESPYKDVEYYLRLYVQLVAARLEPPRELVSRVKGLFPFGITESVARDILASRLPVSLAIRYFGADGKVPMRWIKALEFFSDEGYRFFVSSEEYPVGYELWREQQVGGYYGEESSDVLKLRVPVHAEGEVKVLVHAIELISAGLLDIPKWEPPSSFDDLSGSDTEETPVARDGFKYKPRLLESEPYIAPPPKRIQSYTYDAKLLEMRSRVGSPEFPSQIRAALAGLETGTPIEDFEVQCGTYSELDHRGVERVALLQNKPEASPVVEPQSPGGTVVASFRKTVWETLCAGEPLFGRDAHSFFQSVRANVAGFARSDAFSGWSNVWFGVLRTLSHSENVDLMVRHKLHERASALLLALVQRYSSGVTEVSKNSFHYMGFIKGLVTSRTGYAELLQRQTDRGRAKIAQSPLFFKRLLDIRDALTSVVELWEESGVFVPGVVSALQETLPVFAMVGKKLFDNPGTSNRYVKGQGLKTLHWRSNSR